jgi:ribosomal protein S18 acetylase RimI-like enzyme
MATTRSLRSEDASSVVARIASQLHDDAVLQPLVNDHFDHDALRDTILHATNATWVAHEAGSVVGHLYAAVLGDPHQETAAWTGPDGVSFDSTSILASLVHDAAATWRREGATKHYVWALEHESRLSPWLALGYEPVSVRGVKALGDDEPALLANDLTLRAARASDIARLLELDHVIDLAQGESDSLSRKDRHAMRREMLSLLEDPEVRFYVLERDAHVLAQAITFPLPARRGSFARTVHLSEVVVDPILQRRGVARAMIDTVLLDARRDGFAYVEAQWRRRNVQANSFWPRYGLTPTYARLARTLD